MVDECAVDESRAGWDDHQAISKPSFHDAWEKLCVAWPPDEMRPEHYSRKSAAVGLDHEPLGGGLGGDVRRQMLFGKGFLLVGIAHIVSAKSDAGRARV